MTKPNKKYWEERAEQRELESQLIASLYLARMDESLRVAQQDILQQIEAFYARYSIENKVTLAEARKYLTAKELKDFKDIDLKRFREMSLSGNPEYDNILNAVSYRARISRLEVLNAKINMEMIALYGGPNGLQEYTATGLADVYQSSYYKSMFDIAQAGVMGGAVVALSDTSMREALTYNWSGKEFSERIWGQQIATMDSIKRELEKSFASGRSIAKTTKAIMEQTDVARSRVETLVRTESNFFHGLAAQNSYIEAGIEKYEVLATLDSRTSNICREQDGKVYDAKDYQPGVTANPFHPNCRSTTIAWFDESEYMDDEQRQSADGLIDSVSYEEWAKENIPVENPDVPRVDGVANPSVVKEGVAPGSNYPKAANKSYEGIERSVSDRLDGIVADLQNEYPVDLEYVGSIGGLERLSGQDLSGQRRGAHALHVESSGNGRSILAFNENIGSKRTIANIQSSMDRGYFAVNNVDPLRYTVTHEYGHALDNALRAKGFDFKDSGIVQKFESQAEEFYKNNAKLSAASRDLPKADRKRINAAHSSERKTIMNEFYKNELSVYGSTNYKEFFAEAFTEYKLSDAPRGFAKMVGEFVENGVK